MIVTLEFSLRLGAALLLGACIGLERQWRQRMAGTRTNALVSAGAAAFVMCGFMVRDGSHSEAQIVSYVVSGIGFLGAGVIFKDAGSVRGLNTAATIWCSAAIGAICGLGSPVQALILATAVLGTNIILRPPSYRLYPVQASGEEQEITYGFELICRPEDESHMRALLLQAMSRSSLALTALRSEDIEGTPKMKVTAQIRGLGRQDSALEQLVVRMSLEAGVEFCKLGRACAGPGMNLLDLVVGKPIKTSDERAEQIGPAEGIPIFGLDALSSAAYGPEAALSLLIPLGILGVRYIIPISAAVITLLVIVYFSYRQTIAAYPSGGGSYTVARFNLGAPAGLLAAAALLADYILTVAVGISAGVGALVSAAPSLLPHTVSMCVGILIVITILNLRGVREAGVVFAVPTYLFVGTLLITIAAGLVRVLLSGGHPAPVAPLPTPLPMTEAVSYWLLLKVFASGCTALTGVEAVSNGVKAFRDPAVKNARITLTVIIFLLAVLLAGISYLVNVYGITATGSRQARLPESAFHVDRRRFRQRILLLPDHRVHSFRSVALRQHCLRRFPTPVPDHLAE